MDEPFGSLDVQTRELLQGWELLQISLREQKTVLFVMHSIEEGSIWLIVSSFFTPRPAPIDRILEVPFPRPRSEALKATVSFTELRREIWKLRLGVAI